MKTAVHFGAGNIGRGFIGGLLSMSGYQVVFADINKEVIGALAEKKAYDIVVVDEQVERQKISNVSGLLVSDSALIDAAETAEIITTAVGPVALTKIASTVASMIKRRKEKNITSPLSVIACENMLGGSTVLQEAVMPWLGSDEKSFCEEFVGFPNSVVDRIVPPGTAEGDDILAVRVEPFYEWIVDQTGFKGGVPEIGGMTLTDNLPAYVERKLLTLNTGHAVTAYLGKAFGFSTIRESISDEKINEHVRGAMLESGAALVAKHGFNDEEHKKYIDKIIKRFKNPYLDDSVDRVGREPLRKLSKDDRLVKPIMTAIEYDIDPKNLIYGAAAALLYSNADDKQSVELQDAISKDGVRDAFANVSQLDPASEVVDRVVRVYDMIKNKHS